MRPHELIDTTSSTDPDVRHWALTWRREQARRRYQECRAAAKAHPDRDALRETDSYRETHAAWWQAGDERDDANRILHTYEQRTRRLATAGRAHKTSRARCSRRRQSPGRCSSSRSSASSGDPDGGGDPDGDSEGDRAPPRPLAGRPSSSVCARSRATRVAPITASPQLADSPLRMGGLLRQTRLRRQFTLAQLALASDVSVRCIEYLEGGASHQPRGRTIRQLAKALGIDPDALAKSFTSNTGPAPEATG